MYRVQFEWRSPNNGFAVAYKDFTDKALAYSFANAFLPTGGLRAARTDLGEIASDGQAVIRVFQVDYKDKDAAEIVSLKGDGSAT